MVTKLSKIPLVHQPSEVWEYSMADDVLGRIIEVVSGTRLDRFVAERVTGPLHMTATDFYVHETNLSRRRSSAGRRVQAAVAVRCYEEAAVPAAE